MKLYLSLLLYGLLTITGTSRSSPVEVESNGAILPQPEIGWKPSLPANTETEFFQNMTEEDRIWFMTESILVHLNENVGLNSTVPDSLKSRMLNGEIPPNLQKMFTKWLTEDLGFNNHDMKTLLSRKEVCGNSICSTLPGLGQTCCPFG